MSTPGPDPQMRLSGEEIDAYYAAHPEEAAAPTGPAEETGGVWVAFNWDGSAFVPFASELEALRHANGYHMPVQFVEFGDEEWMRR